MDIVNRVVAITGGARGIGLCTAEAFRAAGAKVVIGDIDADLAESTSKALNARFGSGVIGTYLDVTDLESFTAFIETAETEWGRLDILVNNGADPAARSGYQCRISAS